MTMTVTTTLRTQATVMLTAALLSCRAGWSHMLKKTARASIVVWEQVLQCMPASAQAGRAG